MHTYLNSDLYLALVIELHKQDDRQEIIHVQPLMVVKVSFGI